MPDCWLDLLLVSLCKSLSVSEPQFPHLYKVGVLSPRDAGWVEAGGGWSSNAIAWASCFPFRCGRSPAPWGSCKVPAGPFCIWAVPSLPTELPWRFILSVRPHAPPSQRRRRGRGLGARRGPGAAGQLPGVRSRPTLWMLRCQVPPETDRLCPPPPLRPAPGAAALRRPLLAVRWGWTRTPWMRMKTGPAAMKRSLGTPHNARTRWPSG